MERRHLKRCTGDKVFDTVIFIILTFIFFVVAYPLYFVIISSISDPELVAAGKVVLYPMGVTADGYLKVFETKEVLRGFVNSLIITTMGVSINLAVTLPTSYALSRPDFALKKPITFFYLITMFVGGGMIPTYLVVKGTNLLNTWWAITVPGAISVYNMIVARTFFVTNIPVELMDAAKIDGCGNTRFFFSIVLPLSGAITAILFLYYGVGHWNSYFSALLYIDDRNKQPLQMELRSILLQDTINKTKTVLTEAERAEKNRLEALKEMMKYSLIIVSSIPVLIIYPFVQKYFVKGVMIGSIKG